MDRAPGSNASSLYPHLLLERVLEPWAVVEVGTAKVQASSTSHGTPCIFPTDRAQRIWGLELCYLPSSGSSRSLWVLNANGRSHAGILPWALKSDQMSSIARARSLVHGHTFTRTRTSEPDLCAISRALEQPARSHTYI